MNIQEIRDFFDRFKKAIDEYSIEKEDIWNINETGLRINIGRG